jgi:hypothetical protein
VVKRWGLEAVAQWERAAAQLGRDKTEGLGVAEFFFFGTRRGGFLGEGARGGEFFF